MIALASSTLSNQSRFRHSSRNDPLPASVGLVAMVKACFGGCAQQGCRIVGRKQTVNPEHKLPVVRQCQLLGLARSTVYYRPWPVSEFDLALVHRIDELLL